MTGDLKLKVFRLLFSIIISPKEKRIKRGITAKFGEDPQKEKCRVSILNIIMIDNQKNKLMLSLRYRDLRFAI